MVRSTTKPYRFLSAILSLCLAVLCAGSLTVPVNAAGQGYSDLYEVHSMVGVERDPNISAVALVYGLESNKASNSVIIMKENSKRGEVMMDVTTRAQLDKMLAGSVSTSQISVADYNEYMLKNGASDEYLILDEKPPIVDDILKATSSGNSSMKDSQSLVIMPEALRLAAERGGRNFVIHCDTMDGGKVNTRISVTPSQTTKGIVTLATSSGHPEYPVIQQYEKKYTNKFAAVEFLQEGSFGTTVGVKAKIDLSRLNANSLRFYSFNRITGKYTELENPQYSVDSKGYLTFFTDRGNTMLITDKALQKK